MYPVPRAVTSDDPPLVQFLRLCRRHWFLIGAAGLVGVLAGAGLSLTGEDVYQSDAELLLSGSSGSSSQFVEGPLSGDPDRRIENEIELMESGGVQDAVEESTGLRIGVSASAANDSDVITVSTTAGGPDEAAADLETWVDTYIELQRTSEADQMLAAADRALEAVDDVKAQIATTRRPVRQAEQAVVAAPPGPERDDAQLRLDQLRETVGPQVSQLQSQLATLQDQATALASEATTLSGSLTVITPPSAPSEPEAAGLTGAVLIGLVVGLLVGLAISVGREQLDSSIRTGEDLRRVRNDVDLLGTIPHYHPGKDNPPGVPIVVAEPRSPVSESYRSIATSLGLLSFEHASAALQITSPVAGDGKTTVAANLGVALARTGQNVILLDADLRRPSLHERFGVETTSGTFGDVLIDGRDPLEVCMDVGVENLRLIPARPTEANPADLLQSDIARKVIERLSGVCDILIIDSPPVLPVADALIIGRHVDRAILVTAASSTRRDQVAAAIDGIHAMRTEVTGMILNGVEAKATYSYYSRVEPAVG
jgi:capsular exopolysaccharide synthesis family protein